MGVIGYGWSPAVDTQKEPGALPGHHSVANYLERCGLRVGGRAPGAKAICARGQARRRSQGGERAGAALVASSSKSGGLTSR